MKIWNARTNFLQAIGVNGDPFATPVAEQELNRDDPETSFYSFFSEQISSDLPEPLSVFDALRGPRHTFVYADPGGGKTALRLALEADSRHERSHTLVISYVMGEDVRGSIEPGKHWQNLAQALALDLYVQLLERLSPNAPEPTPQQLAALHEQMFASGCYLSRLVAKILDEPHPKAPAGIGSYFPLVGRSAIRYVPATPALLRLARLSIPPAAMAQRRMEGSAALQAGIRAARLWGFQQILIAVDGVDTRERSTDTMLALLLPLLEKLGEWEEQDIAVKFFLPLELQPILTEYLTDTPLISPPIASKIEWHPDDLRKIIQRRFGGAGSRYVGFDQLAAPEFAGELDNLILRSANGSPRRLLRIVSSLIDAHVSRAGESPKFDRLDWKRMRDTWGYDDVPPEPD